MDKSLIDLDKVERLCAIFEENVLHLGRNANVKILMMDTTFRVEKVMKTRITQPI